MTRNHRRRYRTRLVCPECGLSEFFQTADGQRLGCVDCFSLDGEAIEPVLTMSTIPDPPTRRLRLIGIPVRSPLRKTRSR